MPSVSFFLNLCVLYLFATSASAGLSPSFYDQSCPNVQNIVRNQTAEEVNQNPGMAASLVRLHQLDCFVHGCDASNLLDDTVDFVGEKNAAPNQNSARGFGVVDKIKAKVEVECPGVVSCADILALSARDSVNLLGGPSWIVSLGRRDARIASQSEANGQIPSPSSGLATLISMFEAKGLSARDLTALSGAHTIGQAQCKAFRSRIYNETNIESNFAASRRSSCPLSGGDGTRSALEIQTPLRFDNNYFKDLVILRGLLHSDQVLFDGGSQDDLVKHYSENLGAFFGDFAIAMQKMGNISPLLGIDGEIRKNCRVRNRS